MPAGGHRIPPCLITAASIQGTRQTFEDRIDVSARVATYSSFVYCGVFDGHGGYKAAESARISLLPCIEKQPGFMSIYEEEFKTAIKDGFALFQKNLKKESETWDRTNGEMHPNDGTTASIVIIARGWAFIAYVGDSPIFLIQKDGKSAPTGTAYGPMHDNRNTTEHEDIKKAGGDVIDEGGKKYAIMPRHRTCCPRLLRMSRTLGDFWLSNMAGEPILSSEPVITVVDLTVIPNEFYIVIGSDGLVVHNPKELARRVWTADHRGLNPAHHLINRFVQDCTIDAEFDNVSVICMKFTHKMLEGLKYEFDCASGEYQVLKGNSYNKILTSNPTGCLYFKGGRAFLKDMDKPVIHGNPKMKRKPIKEPGFVIPKIVERPTDENEPSTEVRLAGDCLVKFLINI